jgi:hypothetical protein
VGFWIGKCSSGHKLGDGHTGWGSMSRVVITTSTVNESSTITKSEWPKYKLPYYFVSVL